MEFEIEDPHQLLNPHSAIHLFNRTVVVEGVPKDSNVDEEMREWMTAQLNLLGFAFVREFGKRAHSLGLYWEET